MLISRETLTELAVLVVCLMFLADASGVYDVHFFFLSQEGCLP
jgi:hypothetical protein